MKPQHKVTSIVDEDMSKIITELPKTVENVGDILSAPLFVLHARSAKKETAAISVSWTQPKMVRYEVRTKKSPKENHSDLPAVPSRFGETEVERVKVEYFDVKRTFAFSRSKDTENLVKKHPKEKDPDLGAYPTVEHAQYLHILLCLFIENIKRGGGRRLYFRFRDVFAAAGKGPRSNSRTIKSAIKRYQSCQVVWISDFGTGEVETLKYNIIKKSSIIDENASEELSGSPNPRRSKNKRDWHFVEFDEEVVETLNKNISRFLLTQTFKSLKPDTASVYRYYYSLSDTSSGGKNVYHARNLAFLMKVFCWEGQKNRFKPWLESKFKELLEYKPHPSDKEFSPLINEPIWDHETAVKIRCKGYKGNLTAIKEIYARLP